MKKWTIEEDEVILKAIKDCPNNLSLAFEAASQVLNRTEKSCAYRWYNVISKRADKSSIALVCISKNAYGVNRKNCKNLRNNQNSTGFNKVWRAIVNFFGI